MLHQRLPSPTCLFESRHFPSPASRAFVEQTAGQIVAHQLGDVHNPQDAPGAADVTHDADI
jgi:hypothetical protein